MHIKIIGFAFAIALLSMIGFAYFGTSGTTEAAIHPIVQSACAAEDTEQADPRNPRGQINNPSTGPGMPHDGNGDDGHTEEADGHDGASDSGRHADHPFRNSNENATSGEGTANCTNG